MLTKPFFTTTFENNFSALFDGVDEFINLGAIANFERTDPWSLVCWFKSSGALGGIVSKRGATPTFTGWELNNSGGQIRFNLTNNNAVANRLQVLTSSGGFNDGDWHHIVVTYDGSSTPGGIIMYIDGSSEALDTDFNALTGNIANSTSANIGARNSGDNLWDGLLDEVAIYDVELSAAEAGIIYNSGIARDLSKLSTSTNLVGWWRFTQVDIDNFPTIADNSGNAADGTATNMEVGDIQVDVP